MLPLLSFLLFALSAIPAAQQRHDFLSDQHALLAFKNSLTVHSLHDWISTHHAICNWTGVTCSSRRQRVVSLNLTGMEIQGPISPFIGNLSFLRVLALRKNTFQGHIPYELGRLSRLRILRLSQNELQGSIPPTLGRCRNLRRLILSYNHLSGSIPVQLGLLSNLEAMILAVNQLTGEIPSLIGNMSALTDLELGENRLHGPIPLELGMLTQLQILSLDTNNLTGSIPAALFNCTQLQHVVLSDNRLHGPIPLELGMLTQLQILFLHINNLTGSIPTTLSNCTQLQNLQLAYNRLSGTVPIEFGKLLHLQQLRLHTNQLVSGGSSLLILTALTNCSQLEGIQLADNYFSGVLPSSVGQLSGSLSILALGLNQLEGNIPGEIGNLKNLTLVDLSYNHFTGTIPTTFGRLQNVERLWLKRNYLRGKIPNNLDQLKRLGSLYLSDNMLSGQIPDTLGNLPQLRELYLDHNQLSGHIPAKLGRCTTLEVVNLAYNKLSGNIPPEVAGLANLQFYFNASNNLLEGLLPIEIGKMTMVQAIDVSVNHLSGGIPGTLTSCTNLQYLNLSRNALQGPIPNSLVDVKNLEDMDLSCNNLSGTIPVAFKNMKVLKHLNLSSNKLIGEVPNNGIFTQLDASAFAGNPGLCGSWIQLPACSGSKHRHSLILKIVIVIVVVVGTVFLICLLFLRFHWKRNNKGQNAFAFKFGPRRISYEEIVDATQGFNETNMIGIGSFGSVYKGTLTNGTVIAIKVLHLQDEEAHQSFHRECNALRRARHRNVIKIRNSCSNLDFKALVLPFMSNGNLERWLHPPREDAIKLNLSERLRIAMEIAQGMAYLHHHCFEQIVHCDLKPSNVLLGDDMTAYIADFGIARLICGDSVEVTSTNALQGSIGYVAPEYGVGGNVSTKGDVYSYGIVLLELLTGKKPTDDMFQGGMSLPKWAAMDFPNRVREVVDNILIEDVNESEMSSVLTCISQLMEVGLVCANERAQERPNMMEVVDGVDKIRGVFVGMPRRF